MQTIITKFLSATNSRGARIQATCWNGKVTISYPYELSGVDCHRKAAEALIEKLQNIADVQWEIKAHGEMPCGNGYAFVIGFPAANPCHMVPEVNPIKR